jgi:hypothetical protein
LIGVAVGETTLPSSCFCGVLSPLKCRTLAGRGTSLRVRGFESLEAGSLGVGVSA